ncbi:MAG TPA: CpaD family pilus assembly protein [Caulobacteraceae bacterium]|jgi:pilus assembly protein CpaD
MGPVTKTLRTATPLLLALLAGACASAGEDRAALEPAPITPTEQFPIEVRQRPEELRLAAHAEGLSPAQEQAVAELAARWRGQGGGVITIIAPTVGGLPAGLAVAEASRGLLLSLGVDPAQLRLASYEAPPEAPPLVRIGFVSYEAAGPVCGEWENLSKTGSNRPYANFGCAITANMAAQVANPHDFLAPRAEDPADATRRAVVLDKYRRGERTSTQADPQAKGAVSDRVGGN